jgi:hypothetical protein
MTMYRHMSHTRAAASCGRRWPGRSHEVAHEVHAGAAGQHHRRRCDLVDEPRQDVHVGTRVLEEALSVWSDVFIAFGLLE